MLLLNNKAKDMRTTTGTVNKYGFEWQCQTEKPQLNPATSAGQASSLVYGGSGKDANNGHFY